MKKEFKKPKSKVCLENELQDIFSKDMFVGNSILLSNEDNESIKVINNLTVLTGDTIYNQIITPNYQSIYNQISISNNSILPTHNDYRSKTIEPLVTSTDTEETGETFLANLPLFFEQSNKLYIPSKTERFIERYISKKELKKINPDLEIAKELCLMFLSNLSNSFYLTISTWKALHSKILLEQFGNVYIKIIELLIESGVIERSTFFNIGQESYRYKLTDVYLNKGIVTYELKTNFAKNIRRKTYFKTLNASIINPIANNLIKMYSSIEIPSVEEIKKEAKRLVKLNYTTKKGKKLTFLNKHSKSYWKDYEDRSFVEESIELFLRLTQNGFLIPMIGDEKSGGRVVDSFTLMPAWIRNMCKIDGKRIEEADYSALHPNIAMNIYNGNFEYITHEQIAQELDKDIKEVKIEHLSFFNKTWNQMTKSFLFDYYCKNEPTLMENIFKDKDSSKFEHKITSMKMFKVEVDIMTSVIKELNSEGIYVGYVYDALFCNPKNKKRVSDIMNEKILNFGVKTKAK